MKGLRGRRSEFETSETVDAAGTRQNRLQTAPNVPRMWSCWPEGGLGPVTRKTPTLGFLKKGHWRVLLPPSQNSHKQWCSPPFLSPVVHPQQLCRVFNSLPRLQQSAGAAIARTHLAGVQAWRPRNHHTATRRSRSAPVPSAAPCHVRFATERCVACAGCRPGVGAAALPHIATLSIFLSASKHNQLVLARVRMLV